MAISLTTDTFFPNMIILPRNYFDQLYDYGETLLPVQQEIPTPLGPYMKSLYTDILSSDLIQLLFV